MSAASEMMAANDRPDLEQWLQGRSFEDWYAEYDRNGFVRIPNVLTREDVAAVREALDPYLTKNITGRNDFEGYASNRVYALLAKGAIFSKLAAHPLALAFVERELGPTALLSACLAINLHPGESVQPWHWDDSHIEVPLPRRPFGVSTFWAIDDMTETNGSTEIIPRSHLWTEAETNELQDVDFTTRREHDAPDANIDPAAHPDGLKATMPSGSLMIAKGTLTHRGGANVSDAARLIITPQYCAGWARPLENMSLAVPPHIAKTLPERAQELLGYSIHAPFMGYVDGTHPKRVLAS
ncbi:MAG: phytanoyl-CoA dioxygenase family protein [Pseudomonadota bacterium]